MLTFVIKANRKIARLGGKCRAIPTPWSASRTLASGPFTTNIFSLEAIPMIWKCENLTLHISISLYHRFMCIASPLDLYWEADPGVPSFLLQVKEAAFMDTVAHCATSFNRTSGQNGNESWGWGGDRDSDRASEGRSSLPEVWPCQLWSLKKIEGFATLHTIFDTPSNLDTFHLYSLFQILLRALRTKNWKPWRRDPRDGLPPLLPIIRCG